jgi:hypothetical protein
MVIVAVIGSGCASTPDMGDATNSTVFPHSIVKVQKASVSALSETGFDVTKQEPAYVEGFRPRKVGLAVGSGGETAGIWLTSQGEDKTEVKVDTAKSLVGIAGQQSWNDEIISAIRKALAR